MVRGSLGGGVEGSGRVEGGGRGGAGPACHRQPLDAWQVAYSLMVWLSMVVMVPFDLSIIDSSAIGKGDEQAAVPLVIRPTRPETSSHPR